MNIPVIFELDIDGEATGIIHPFCCEACCLLSPYSKEGHCLGQSALEDFGFVPHCEGCGQEIR